MGAEEPKGIDDNDGMGFVAVSLGISHRFKALDGRPEEDFLIENFVPLGRTQAVAQGAFQAGVVHRLLISNFGCPVDGVRDPN
jgi:hypothetical protein